MIISKNLFELIKHYESLHDGDLTVAGLQPKLCPAGYWTEGYGRLVLDMHGKPVSGASRKISAYKYSVIKTIEQAEAALTEDIEVRTLEVQKLNIQGLMPWQEDALVSFAYNVGIQALKDSTLLFTIRKDPNNMEGIERQFLRWDKATVNGKKVTLLGLSYRRQSEALMYTNNELKFFNV